MSLNPSTSPSVSFETLPAPLAPGVNAVDLSADQIRRYLAVYRPESIHITRAIYAESGELRVLVRPYCPEIYLRCPKHLTRVQIVHHLGQAAYVLLGCLACEGRLGSMTENGYLTCINNEGATFRKLSLKFRRFVPSADNISLTVWCQRVQELKGYLQLDLRFEFGNRDCVGHAEAVLLPHTRLLTRFRAVGFPH